MVNEDEITELLKNSATKIKGNKALFSDFVRLYVVNGGNPKSCMGCNFSSVYQRWKSQLSKPKIKPFMGTGKRTFKLKNDNKTYPILGESFVFSKNHSDEEAIYWINHPSGDVEKRKLEFLILPEDLRGDKKGVALNKKTARKNKKSSK